MQFVTYNIQYGKGQDAQINLKRIAKEVAGADVIALQEVERFWPRTGMIDQVAVLSKLLPDYHWVYGAGVDMHVEDSTPQAHKRRRFGNMILSRNPILRSRHYLLPKCGSISPGPLSIQRSAIESTIQCGNHNLRIYSIHLTHLSSTTRQPQVDKLLNIHNTAVHEGAPLTGDMRKFDWNDTIVDQTVSPLAIMMGDFNCQPDSLEYTSVVGPLSDYGGRISSPDGFVDAWSQAGYERNTGFTCELNDQPVTFDYCFVSSALSHLIQNCRVDNSATGSDHFPVWTEINL